MTGMPSEGADARRILDHYRRLILLGKALLPLEAARRLVGPDCAYHLYFRHAGRRPHGAKGRAATKRHR